MRAQGFTLIELLITLAIVAVLAGLALPNMGEYIEQERVRGALINLKQELSYARSEAIKRNAAVFISSSQGVNWCLGVSLSPDCDCALADPDAADACALPTNGTKALRRVTSGDYSGVTMDKAQSFEFDGIRGLPYKNGSFSGTIEMSSTSYDGEVVISRIGRVKACGAVSGMESC